VRAAARRSWPSLTYHFGIKPWEVGRLSAGELNEYLAALEELNRPRR